MQLIFIALLIPIGLSVGIPMHCSITGMGLLLAFYCFPRNGLCLLYCSCCLQPWWWFMILLHTWRLHSEFDCWFFLLFFLQKIVSNFSKYLRKLPSSVLCVLTLNDFISYFTACNMSSTSVTVGFCICLCLNNTVSVLLTAIMPLNHPVITPIIFRWRSKIPSVHWVDIPHSVLAQIFINLYRTSHWWQRHTVKIMQPKLIRLGGHNGCHIRLLQ